MDVVNLISGSSAFSKSRLNIWKFSVHVLLKPSLENFEHPGDLPDPGIEPISPALAGVFFTAEPPGKPG